MTKQEIFHKLADLLCQSLNVERTDIWLNSTLIGDLGAESIDFLDITFRIEREFGIKIKRGDLFPDEDCEVKIKPQTYTVEMLQDYVFERVNK